MEIYLVKEGCGTHIVFDQAELERHLKMGWQKRPTDWQEKAQAENKVKRLEAAKAEQARLAAEVAALEGEAPKNKGGRPKKVVVE